MDFDRLCLPERWCALIVAGEPVVRWVAEAFDGRYYPDYKAVGWMSNGELVAGIMYTDYTGTSISMHSRVVKRSAVNRKWLFAIFDYPFNQLKVKHVRGLVSTANAQAIKTNEHLGWKRETTLADYFPDGDGIVYYMRREDCRWLTVPDRRGLAKGTRHGRQTISSAA